MPRRTERRSRAPLRRPEICASSIGGKTINDLARRVLHGDARLRLLWPPFFPEVVYDSTGVFDGGSVDNEDIVKTRAGGRHSHLNGSTAAISGTRSRRIGRVLFLCFQLMNGAIGGP